MNDVTEYEKVRPVYEAYAHKLRELLELLLQGQGVDYHLVECRAKEIDSYKRKLSRVEKNYSNPIAEITDLVGLRIIVFYQRDIKRVEDLIKANFVVDEQHSIDKKADLKENEFGYLSSHYIVKLNEHRNNLPEWKSYNNINAEIQLRTVLQHAWAAISHELQYKSTFEVPSILKRRLFRLAGLFELADEEFGTIKDKQLQLAKAIEEKQSIEDQPVYNEVNLDTINDFLINDTEILPILKQIALEAGFSEDHFSSSSDGSTMLYSEIISLLSMINVDSIEDFKKLLRNKLKIAPEYLKLIYQTNTEEGGSERWDVDDEFIIILLLLSCLPKQALDEYKGRNWHMDLLNRVKNSIRVWKYNTSES